MTATPTTSDATLRGLGNVPQEYQHEWRVARPLEPIVVAGGMFKWYHVHREAAAVSDELDARARRVITDGAPDWNLEYGLNFALLHQSTAQAFLIVGVWRGHQELWTRAYVYDLADDGPFMPVERSGEDAPAACVWELGVICHERMAWHRYLFSGRDDADKRAWIDDTYAGVV